MRKSHVSCSRVQEQSVSKPYGARRGVSFQFRVGGDITECVNIYDIRLDDTYPACGSNWPYELANITEYLQVWFWVSDTGNAQGSSPFAEKGCNDGTPCDGEIHRLGGMRLSRAHCIDEPEFPILCDIDA